MNSPEAATHVLHPVDQRLLGLTFRDAERSSFELRESLARHDGRLFGGTALSAAFATMEAASKRDALWATVQFVGSADVGDRIDCVARVVAHGRRVDQVQVDATVGDRLVFTAVGSCGEARDGTMHGVGHEMPGVVGVEECEPFLRTHRFTETSAGHHRISEFLQTRFLDEAAERPGHLAMWARVTGEVEASPAKYGFLADMVPVAVVRACGHVGAGTSLDNSLRVTSLVDTEWILTEIEAHAAAGGYGHGSVHLWSPDGTHLATGSQTAKLFAFDPDTGEITGS